MFSHDQTRIMTVPLLTLSYKSHAVASVVFCSVESSHEVEPVPREEGKISSAFEGWNSEKSVDRF